MPVQALPLIDEHSTIVQADAATLWAALADEPPSSSALTELGARLLGCAETASAGPRPLSAGSSVPGFRVALAEPPHELALVGRHRFSRYALTWRIEDLGPGRSLLRAETRADFPGVLGRAYRALVIDSRAHVVAVRGLLRTIRRRAEGREPS